MKINKLREQIAFLNSRVTAQWIRQLWDSLNLPDIGEHLARKFESMDCDVMRWALELDSYNFSILNGAADDHLRNINQQIEEGQIMDIKGKIVESIASAMCGIIQNAGDTIFSLDRNSTAVEELGWALHMHGVNNELIEQIFDIDHDDHKEWVVDCVDAATKGDK